MVGGGAKTGQPLAPAQTHHDTRMMGQTNGPATTTTTTRSFHQNIPGAAPQRRLPDIHFAAMSATEGLELAPTGRARRSPWTTPESVYVADVAAHKTALSKGCLGPYLPTAPGFPPALHSVHQNRPSIGAAGPLDGPSRRQSTSFRGHTRHTQTASLIRSCEGHDPGRHPPLQTPPRC